MDKEDLRKIGPIGVLMGGCSSEREISLKSGKAVLKALEDEGLEVAAVVIDSEDEEVNKNLLKQSRIRLAFIAMHGRYGEDGGIQTVLDSVGIPYAGSGPQASRRAMNKIVTQDLFKNAGLPIPESCVVESGSLDVMSKIQGVFNGDAVVVKPAMEGSSIGIRIVKDYMCLDEALQEAFYYGEQVLVERYVKGRELTAGILDDEVLPIVEIRTPGGFFDFEAKYKKGITEYCVPADLETETVRQIKALSLAAFETIGCRDFSRVDFLLTEKNKPHILEINTIPGFTETSLLPMAASCAGYSFSQLCIRLMVLALGRVEK